MAGVPEFTDSNFQQEVLESNEPVLVDFWAVWCGPCRQIAPIVQELAGVYEGKAKLGKLNVDDNRDVSEQYGIRSIPTLLIFKDGKVVEQIVGAVPRHHIVNALDRHVGTSATA